MSTPDVSIVMACRNEAPSIARTLESILRQRRVEADWEAIIADGASTDGTRAVLEQFCRDHAGFTLIDNPQRIVSTGLNLAVEHSCAPIILRMDAHTDYADDYVEKCVRALRSGVAENVGGAARTRSSGYLQKAIAAAYHSPFSCGGVRFHDAGFEGYVDTVPYGCWWRETLAKLGGFDPSLVRSQDDELNLRLIRSGGRIWQSASIVSWYHPRSSLSRLFQQYFQYGFWKVAVIRKHGKPASWRHLAPATFFGSLAVLSVASLGALMPGASPLFRATALLWTTLTLGYLSAIAFASVLTARRAGFSFLPVLPAVFATYHLSYAAGFLLGMYRFASRQESSSPLVSGLSR